MFLYSHDGVQTRHHRDIQDESLKRYSVVITCLICFVMRCHQGWKSDYSMGLTDAQRRACESLNDVLRGSSARGNESTDLGGEQDWYSCIEEDVLEESDEEECEDGEFYHGDESTGESAPTTRQRIADSATQAGILELLVSLYTQLPTGEDDKFFSPILRFTVLASLRQSGQWLPPRRITHLLAILLFCGREVLMSLMHQHLLDDPTIRYSKWVACN